jgi:mannosyltransferase
MVVLDNIVFDLQRYGGISSIWGSIIKAAVNSKDLSFKFMQSPRHSKKATELCIEQKDIIEDVGNVFFRRWARPAVEQKATVFHSSYFRISSSKHVANVVTVHDCVSERFDSIVRRSLHLKLKKAALRSADIIVAVSENTKSDILTFYPWIDPAKLEVVYNGIDLDFFKPNLAAMNNRTSDAPFLLYVGGRNRHKNSELSLALLSTATAKELGLILCVVGAGRFSRKEMRAIVRVGVVDRVVYFPNVGREKLRTLYQKAFALIYPSFYEGFGIPPIEAIACGCPVLCSDRASIPEVVGDAGVYFSPEDVASAEQALCKIAESAVRSRLVATGLGRAKVFSDTRMAEQTLNVYRMLGG